MRVALGVGCAKASRTSLVRPNFYALTLGLAYVSFEWWEQQESLIQGSRQPMRNEELFVKIGIIYKINRVLIGAIDSCS